MTTKQKYWTARILLGVAIIFVLSLGLPSAHPELAGLRTIGTCCMTAALVIMVHYRKKIKTCR